MTNDVKKQKPTKRRRLFPMPIEGKIDHPLAIAMSAAGYGMLSRLIEHFWVTECRPLPKTERDLRSIMRSHGATWRQYGADVLQVFNDVKPELEQYFQAREHKYAAIIFACNRSVAVRAAKKQAQIVKPLAERQPLRKQENIAPPTASQPKPQGTFTDAA